MTHFIGLDISKHTLDICVFQTKETCQSYRFDNTPLGHQDLIELLRSLPVELVICEPTGGYELAICLALHQEGFAIHRVHTLAFYGFAKSLGFHKNDRIDAYKLAYYGKSMEKKANFVKTDSVLENLVKRREYLTLQISNERKLRQQKSGSGIEKSIDDHIRYLEDAIKQLDQKIEAHLSLCAEKKEKLDILISIPGIGKIIASKLIGTMPELGNKAYDLGQLAALVGVAPYCRDSGKMQGKRFIRGGRRIPRDALYIAVLTGSHKIPLLKALRERLMQKGKPCKVAIVACMRKLLEIIRLLSKRHLTVDFSVKTFLAILMYPHALRLLGQFFLKILTSC